MNSREDQPIGPLVLNFRNCPVPSIVPGHADYFREITLGVSEPPVSREVLKREFVFT